MFIISSMTVAASAVCAEHVQLPSASVRATKLRIMKKEHCRVYLDPATILLPSLLIAIWVTGAVKRDIIPSRSDAGKVYACTLLLSVPT
jgi:hypothetical protein